MTVPAASRHMAMTVPGNLSEITHAGHSGIVEEGDAYAAAIAASAANAFKGARATRNLRVV